MNARAVLRSGRAIAIVLAVLAGTSLTAAPASHATLAIEVSPDPITAYLSGGCEGFGACYRAFGRATPGAAVTVSVTDGLGGEVTATATAANADDPGAGIRAGDWAVSPSVTELGSHGPDPSPITFTAVSTDPAGKTAGPVSATVRKASATPGDATPPVVSLDSSPPSNWCRVGLERACPKTCALAAIVPEQATVGTPAGTVTVPLHRIDLRPFGIPFTTTIIDARQCRTIAQISGSVQDLTRESSGIASEIADVVITIRNQDDVVVRETRSFIRHGTRAFFGETVRIDDFDPGSYEGTVSAIDAWGHRGEETFSFQVFAG